MLINACRETEFLLINCTICFLQKKSRLEAASQYTPPPVAAPVVNISSSTWNSAWTAPPPQTAGIWGVVTNTVSNKAVAKPVHSPQPAPMPVVAMPASIWNADPEPGTRFVFENLILNYFTYLRKKILTLLFFLKKLYWSLKYFCVPSAQSTQKSAASPAAAASKKKPTKSKSKKEEAQIMKIFESKSSKFSDDFTAWCVQTLSALESDVDSEWNVT